MKRLCTICARGDSKGVPGKNLRPLAGKPLLAHSILQAKASGLFEKVAVSSDSEAVLEAAKAFGADLLVRRPAELATDAAPKIPAIRHCAQEAERAGGMRFDIVADLDATAPLRAVEDIAGALRLLESRGVANVLSGSPSRKSPYFNLVECGADGVARLSKPPARPLARRQDAPACFDLNGSVYAWRRDVLMAGDLLFHADTLLYVMPEERSLDIDTEQDLRLAELLMSLRQ